MEKIFLFVFFFLPIIGLGQDIPLTEKNITTKKMENKDRKSIEKTPVEIMTSANPDRRLHLKGQIGYISNPKRAPFGLNLFSFRNNNNFGYYIDYRTDFNVHGLPDRELMDEDWIINTSATPTGDLLEGGYRIFNVGIAMSLFRSEKRATCLYMGYGTSKQKRYEEYDVPWFGTYYSEYSTLKSRNFNIGLLFQYKSSMSWQIGYDSEVPGINVGIGLTFN